MTLVIRKLTKAQLYHKYDKMAKKLGHQFARKFNRDSEDLLDEAQRALGLAIANWELKYDRHRAMPSTYVYQSVMWHLTHVCQPRKRKTTTTLTDTVKMDSLARSSSSWYTRIWNEVGEEGRAFLNIVFECPGELYEVLHPRAPVRSKAALHAYMRETGWTWTEIKSGMAQVELSLI